MGMPEEESKNKGITPAPKNTYTSPKRAVAHSARKCGESQCFSPHFEGFGDARHFAIPVSEVSSSIFRICVRFFGFFVEVQLHERSAGCTC